MARRYSLSCAFAIRTLFVLSCAVGIDGLELSDLPLRTESDRSSSPPTVLHRPLTFTELQPYLIFYGAAMSSISPIVWCYQMIQLNPHIKVGVPEMLAMSFSVVPAQTVLKVAQLNMGMSMKSVLSPLAAFAIMGAVQGGITGHANVWFSRALGLGTPNMMNAFNGFPCSALKDTLSQGIPYTLSGAFERGFLDPLLPSSNSKMLSRVKQGLSVFTTSALGTLVSQVLHNMQFAMVVNSDITYGEAAKEVWRVNGGSMFYKGSLSRGGLMLLVNVLNYLILQDVWKGKEVEGRKEERRGRPAARRQRRRG